MRLIDAERLLTDKMKSMYYHLKNGDIAIPIIDIEHAPTIEAIPKEQYEARLKADLEAILVELQLEIEELRLDRPLFSRGYECYGYEDKTPAEIQQECSDIIQQKINSLKEDSDET